MATATKAPPPLGDINAWCKADCFAYSKSGQMIRSNKINYAGPQQVRAWAKKHKMAKGTTIRFAVISPFGDYIDQGEVKI